MSAEQVWNFADLAVGEDFTFDCRPGLSDGVWNKVSDGEAIGPGDTYPTPFQRLFVPPDAPVTSEEVDQ